MPFVMKYVLTLPVHLVAVIDIYMHIIPVQLVRVHITAVTTNGMALMLFHTPFYIFYI